MSKKISVLWMSTVGIIGVMFGIFYGIFGLEGLPVYQKFVSAEVFSAWSNGLYGSVFIGFSVLLFFAGRHAFQNNDRGLMRALLFGINSWLFVEALFSLIHGVYFNVVVDVVLSAFLSFPLLRGIRSNL